MGTSSCVRPCSSPQPTDHQSEPLNSPNLLSRPEVITVCQGSAGTEAHAAGAAELTDDLWMNGDFILTHFTLLFYSDLNNSQTSRPSETILLRSSLLTEPRRRCCEGHGKLHTRSWAPCHATAGVQCCQPQAPTIDHQRLPNPWVH